MKNMSVHWNFSLNEGTRKITSNLGYQRCICPCWFTQYDSEIDFRHLSSASDSLYQHSLPITTPSEREYEKYYYDARTSVQSR